MSELVSVILNFDINPNFNVCINDDGHGRLQLGINGGLCLFLSGKQSLELEHALAAWNQDQSRQRDEAARDEAAHDERLATEPASDHTPPRDGEVG